MWCLFCNVNRLQCLTFVSRTPSKCFPKTGSTCVFCHRLTSFFFGSVSQDILSPRTRNDVRTTVALLGYQKFVWLDIFQLFCTWTNLQLLRNVTLCLQFLEYARGASGQHFTEVFFCLKAPRVSCFVIFEKKSKTKWFNFPWQWQTEKNSKCSVTWRKNGKFAAATHWSRNPTTTTKSFFFQ